ncbi:PREDICTED: uncharacterized protein LOC107346978 isoform X2 [Acropora digitifera]|uniref:uncharacterized protein LOC107346978 isoform X2 n=1 Tax=Acropora digitifera TaxID=70779 RepID=UPI00077A7DCE|nr:PREDICTED: uncharacterized protein LOC107346978 isoform X2 [Acropora digitifera]
MAVRVGNGRYYKLFSGSSQLKRLFIDDISEPGMLEEEYIQGIVAKVFPAKESPRYEKLCKIVLSDDLEDAATSTQSAAVINVFLLGELADEGSEICEGDRVVLSQAVAECSPTEGHTFQLIAWREKSPVSLWIIGKNGMIRANTVGAVSSSSLRLNTGEKLKVSDMDPDKNVEEKSDSDFSEQTGDVTHKQKSRGKKGKKFLRGSKGVTPSHVGRRVNNLVLLKEFHQSKNSNPSTEEVASANPVSSQSTVESKQTGDNTRYMQGDPHRQLSEVSTLPMDDQDVSASPVTNRVLSTCSFQSHTSSKGSGSNTKAVDARLTPKSSVNGLIPKDYTPVESLMSCAKGGVKRSPSHQHAHDPKRVRKSLSPEPSSSCQLSPSLDNTACNSALPTTKTSQTDVAYSVPPGYTTIVNLQPDTTVNIYGIVKLFKPAWKCRGTDMCSVLVLMDPTVSESCGLECVSFQPSVSRLPNVQKVGDIVRLHRIKITQYQGRLQGKSSRGFAAVVFDRDADLPVTAEIARVSSSTFTLTQGDIDTVESLKHWRERQPLLFPQTNFVTVAQINQDSYFELVCQVVGVAMHHTLDCVVLFVTDGTKPQHDFRACEGDDYGIVEAPDNHSTEEETALVSVFLYGSHAEVARLLAKKGEYIILHNVHSQVLKPGGSVSSVLDVMKPLLELCVHRGTAFGRGLTVLPTDSPEVKQLKRKQGLNGHC